MSDLTPAGSPAVEDVRLLRAAALLRGPIDLNLDGPDRDLVALLLERIAPLAPWWHEPYAAPWVPVIEAAVKLAEQVVGEADGGV